MLTDEKLISKYQNDWVTFTEEALGVLTLDEQQKQILRAVRQERKVSVRSGNARGKDFVAAIASLCFLYLNFPSKVICTAPTGRQVYSIMMSEISSIHENAPVNLGGRLLNNGIKFKDKEWFLLGFKAGDKSKEAWQGFHSEKIMLVVTEATGIEDKVYESIEGILTGNSKLLLVYNPMIKQGEAYKSSFLSSYKHFRLNSMSAPNVTNYEKVRRGEWTEKQYQKNKIPGQVDWMWVDDKVGKDGWSFEINKDDYEEELHFKWRNKYYAPLDPFRIRVLGKYPLESSDQLIPLDWLERSHRLWKETQKDKREVKNPIVGVDVAGQGRDKTVFVYRYVNYIGKIDVLNIKVDDTIHMQIAGRVKQLKGSLGGRYMIDTIGEGAGVFSRLAEQKIEDVYACKGSHSAKGYTDYHELKEFNRMRDYIFWAIRDALDPKNEFNLMLPPNKELDEELQSFNYQVKSSGKIKIRDKEEIKQEIGRSPDTADALAMTFTPI